MTIRDINLVDLDILARQNTLRRLLMWAACLAGALVLIGGYHQYLSRGASAKKNDPASLGRVHTDLSRKIEEIKRIQNDLQTLRLRQQIVETLIKKQPYYQVLQKLSHTMNEYTWVTRVTMERVESTSLDSRLKLNGVSYSNEKLGGLLNRFSAERMFSDAELKYSREVGGARSGGNAVTASRRVQFLIECSVLKGTGG